MVGEMVAGQHVHEFARPIQVGASDDHQLTFTACVGDLAGPRPTNLDSVPIGPPL